MSLADLVEVLKLIDFRIIKGSGMPWTWKDFGWVAWERWQDRVRVADDWESYDDDGQYI